MENKSMRNQSCCLQNDLVDDYLSYLMDKKSRSAMTLDSYTKDISQFLSFLDRENGGQEAISDPAVLSLTAPTAQAFVDSLMAQQFTVSTIGRKATAVRGFYKYLQTTGRIQTNPFAHAYVPQRHAAQIEYLQPRQLYQLLEAIGVANWLALRDQAIVALLYNTGMRVSELLSLTPAQVELERKTVTIHSSGHKTRTCQLQDWVVDTVNRYLESRRTVGNDQTPKTDCLFVNRDGGPLTARSIRRKLKHYSRQANLPLEVGPANLRHSCAMHMLIDGADPKTVRAQLGHLSASSMRPYLDCLSHQNAPVEPAAQPCVPA